VEDTVYEDNLVVINVNKCFILYRRRSHTLYGLIGEGSVGTNKELLVICTLLRILIILRHVRM